MAKPKPKKYYICVVQGEGEPLPTGVRLGNDIAELTEWAMAPQTTSQRKTKTVAPSNDGAPLKTLMTKISESGDQQSEMLAILSVSQAMFPMISIQTEVVEGVVGGANILSDGGSFNISEVTPSILPQLFSALDRVDRVRSGLSHVPNAMLLSLVATFDSQMSDVVRTMLSLKSDRLRTGQRTIPLSEIMNATSLQDIINNAINDEVYQFSRNSHDEQIKYIEESFSIDIRSHWKRWPDLIEVFERRNLAAHGEARFTSRYASICVKHKHKSSEDLVGKPVVVTYKYLKQSLSLLSEFAILLIFSLWRKHGVGDNVDDEAFSSINEVCFSLISNKRFVVATHVAEYALSLKNTGIMDSTRLMLIVNLASAQKHQGNDESAQKTLSSVDWSATSDTFKICVASLREDIQEVIRLLPAVKASSAIEYHSFQTWPVFDYIRGDADFNSAFSKIFKRDLSPEKPATTIATAADELTINESKEEKDTVH